MGSKSQKKNYRGAVKLPPPPAGLGLNWKKWTKSINNKTHHKDPSRNHGFCWSREMCLIPPPSPCTRFTPLNVCLLHVFWNKICSFFKIQMTKECIKHSLIFLYTAMQNLCWHFHINTQKIHHYKSMI